MSKDLYVKNLSHETTEEEIRTLFAVAGKVTYIHLVIDPKTEQFLGCAYVKMSSEAEARDAINALNEARYLNAHISVSIALPRTPPGTPRTQIQKKTFRPASPTGVEKKQARSIAKGDWTGPAPTKKKELSTTPSWRKEGEEGRKSPSDWASKPASAKKPWEKSTEKKEWSATAPSKKERASTPSWRKEGEESRKSPSDWASKPASAKKPWEKSPEKKEWSAAAPAKKERASTPSWRKEGEDSRKGPFDRAAKAAGSKRPWEKQNSESDWTAAAPAKKERSSTPPWQKSAGPKKGPGNKRGK